MREIRPSGSEGGARFKPLSLPLSPQPPALASPNMGENFHANPTAGGVRVQLQLIQYQARIPLTTWP